VFSVRSVLRCYKRDKMGAEVNQSVELSWVEFSWGEWSAAGWWACKSVSQSRGTVAETRDSSRTQSKGNVCLWKLLPSNG
jgi:hypothetical protein